MYNSTRSNSYNVFFSFSFFFFFWFQKRIAAKNWSERIVPYERPVKRIRVPRSYKYLNRDWTRRAVPEYTPWSQRTVKTTFRRSMMMERRSFSFHVTDRFNPTKITKSSEILLLRSSITIVFLVEKTRWHGMIRNVRSNRGEGEGRGREKEGREREKRKELLLQNIKKKKKRREAAARSIERVRLLKRRKRK